MIPRALCSTVRIKRKVISAELGIAPHGAGTSVHDLNVLFNHLPKLQATQCGRNEDTKKSVDLRDLCGTFHCLTRLTRPKSEVRCSLPNFCHSTCRTHCDVLLESLCSSGRKSPHGRKCIPPCQHLSPEVSQLIQEACSLQLPDFWVVLSGFTPTRLLHILFKYQSCSHLAERLLYPSQKSN